MVPVSVLQIIIFFFLKPNINKLYPCRAKPLPMEAPAEDRTHSTQAHRLTIIPFDYKIELIGAAKISVFWYFTSTMQLQKKYYLGF